MAVYDASGNLKKTYDIVIYGDINGDGAVNALDMIKLNRHILGKGTLTGAYLEAADANRKGDGGNDNHEQTHTGQIKDIAELEM